MYYMERGVTDATHLVCDFRSRVWACISSCPGVERVGEAVPAVVPIDAVHRASVAGGHIQVAVVVEVGPRNRIGLLGGRRIEDRCEGGIPVVAVDAVVSCIGRLGPLQSAAAVLVFPVDVATVVGW